MIPFNNYGHSKKTSGVDILYWVDASDSGSYSVDGSNNVTQLINKGSAGGVFTINGSPKYLNGGFEGVSGADYFNRDVGIFLPNNSFTMVGAYKLTNATNSYIFSLGKGTSNLTSFGQWSTTERSVTYHSGVLKVDSVPTTFALQICVITYDLNTNTLSILMPDGSIVNNSSIVFNSSQNDIITLLSLNTAFPMGANNPLHEFRLYDYAMSQQQMTDLQTQLNNKWI